MAKAPPIGAFDLERLSRRNRDSLEITAEILKIASDGARRTRIMYQANLSFSLMERYLSRLMQSGLIVNDNSERMYYTSEKGKLFLKEYQEFRHHRTLINRKELLLGKLLKREARA